VKQAGSTIPLSEHISCHSLRKTFGYHAWTAGVDPTMLMVIFNHSSFTITKRYLGIEQEDKDRIFLDLNL
jgi:integrase